MTGPMRSARLVGGRFDGAEHTGPMTRLPSERLWVTSASHRDWWRSPQPGATVYRLASFEADQATYVLAGLDFDAQRSADDRDLVVA